MLKSVPSVVHVALIALITLAVPGCEKERSFPVYRENPAPRDALPIVIRVRDAPVDVPVPSVFVTYEMDPLCLPPVNNYEGVQYEPNQHTVEVRAQRITATEFSSVIFRDGMEVADYYGRGPCTWTPGLIKASFTFMAGDRKINAATSALIKEIEVDEGSTTYVEKALTPRIPEQTPEWAWTLSRTLFEGLPLSDRQNYFQIEMGRGIDGEEAP